MLKTYSISKKDFSKLLESISSEVNLYAPLKKGLVRFENLKKSDVKNIYLEKNAYFPIKEHFFRKKETLFTFKDGNIKEPILESPPAVYFGLRRCDLNAIMHQDKVFTEQVNDPYYVALRKNSLLFGYHCNTAPSEFCFCGTLDLKECGDLMFFDKKGIAKDASFVVEVVSEKGQAFVDKYKKFFKSADEIKISAEDKKIPGTDRLKVKDISKLYDNPDWKKGVDQCLSCGACTSLCPTCYCFEIKDEVKIDGSGKRVKEWSSCQTQDFTRVAGDHVFREKREERFKHRIYHQLDYFKQKNGVDLCVGCGRCISGCPTRIDFVDIINKMKK